MSSLSNTPLKTFHLLEAQISVLNETHTHKERKKLREAERKVKASARERQENSKVQLDE